MLKYALEPHGFGEVFAQGAEMKKKVTPVEDKEEVDNAAKAVMELFYSIESYASYGSFWYQMQMRDAMGMVSVDRPEAIQLRLFYLVPFGT